MISSRLLGPGSSRGLSKSKSNEDIDYSPLCIQIVIISITKYRGKMRRAIKIDDSILAYLNKNEYHINIIHCDKNAFQIKSEQKIIHYGQLTSLEKSFMEKNATVRYYYLLIVDRKFTWTVFRIKSSQQEPQQIYTGTILSEKYQLGHIIGVVEIEGKVVIIFNNFKLLYLLFPREDQFNLHIASREFVPYGQEPEFEHAKFAVESYLPNEEQQLPILCVYSKQQSRGKQQSNGILLMAYKSTTDSLCSVYSIEYNPSTGYFLSGKGVLHNIDHVIINIFPTWLPNLFIIQLTQHLILWKIPSTATEQSSYTRYQITLKSHLYPFKKQQSGQYFAGVSVANKCIVISLNKAGQIQQEELKGIEVIDLPIIEVYPSLKKDQHHYLSKKEQLYFLASKVRMKVISNEHTSITSSTLCLNANYNAIVIEKLRGQQIQKIIYGNHLFAYDAQHYLHGLLYSNSTLLYSEVNSQKISAFLSSPLVATQRVDFILSQSQNKQPKSKNEKQFQITIDSLPKYTKDQSLYLSNKYQITSEEVNEIGKKTTKISKLFQEATDYITKAAVFSNELVTLAISDQIHVFDSKLVRKYIYCCSGEIKNIVSLNDINLLGVELFETGKGGNELIVLILELDKARKMKTLSIPEAYNHIQLSTVINTAQYKLNLFGRRVIVCSNDALHRFQLEKIQVQDYELPLPSSPYSNLFICPLFTMANEKTSTDFLLIFRQEQIDHQKEIDQVEIYFASFNAKYLFKKFDLSNLTISFQRVLTLSSLPRDQPCFAIMHQFEEGLSKNPTIYRNLLIFGEKYASLLNLKLGRVQLEWLDSQTYLKQQINKLQCLPREIIQTYNRLAIEKPIHILPTNKKQYFLLYNNGEIYYTSCTAGKIQQISYYSLINDDFIEFRNNISVGEIEDEQFMQLFNKKMVIKGVKYLNDSTIFVLYESAIIVLEIGYNNSLVVRQELKFKSQNEGEVIKIQEFLQNYDEYSIYLRDLHQRIYLLKLVEGTYQIILHSNIDEDVMIFSRVANWNKRERLYQLGAASGQNRYGEELVLKKDGQLVVKNLLEQGQQSHKMAYL